MSRASRLGWLVATGIGASAGVLLGKLLADALL
jgi:hypothetical protein